MNALCTSMKEKHFRSTFWILFGLSLMHLKYLEAQSNQSNHVFFDGNGSVELFYTGEFDNITVVTLYNRSLGILQYFLKWEDAAPDDYTLKVFPLSSCEVKSVFLDHLNWTISEFYIPPTANYNFQIYKNCTYDIEIKANGHYLNVISYIPDGMEIDINSTTHIKAKHIFLYSAYNITIDRIQYVLKWKDSVPEDGYEVRIFSSSNDYCKSQMYSSSHINKSIAELYIPSTSVSDFELYGNCSYDIEINTDERKLNIKNYIPGSVDTKHILLITINNETINGIQYIMRWEDAAPEIYSVTVVMNSVSNSTYCNDKPYDSFDLNATVTELYIPPTDNYDFSLSGNCTYDIKVRTEETEKNIVNYIPVCVGNMCNCKILSPQPRIPPSIEQIGTKLNISWSFYDSRENNITRIAIYLFEVTCDSSGNFTELKPNVLENNYALININEDMNGEHCITVSFTNTFNCSFSHADVKEVIYMRHIAIQFWINWLIAIIILAVLATFVICYFLLFHKFICKNWRFLQSNQNDRNSVSAVLRRKENINLLYKEILECTKDKYEFPTRQITLLSEIGKGAFGEVFLAKLIIRKETKYVAVKRLREKATHEEREDFLDEINILKKIGCHPNIITLVGCCTIQEPYMMIMEFTPFGDLRKHLLDLRNQWNNRKLSFDSSVFNSRSSAYIIPDSADSPTTPKSKVSITTQYINLSSIDTPKSNFTEFEFKIEKVLNHQELQSFALQIARGMEHLEKIPITHRDLAARNILINEHKVLKISDFGLSRNGPYINNKSKKLPLRWMAIESIEDHIYDNKSDVWAFAVVLWEIATLGAFPYEKVPDSMLLFYLQNGKRLQKPEICTDELYYLMLKCWSRDKNSRPTFAELVKLLDVKTTRVYVDFVQLNPLYVFPPTTCYNDVIPERVVNENTSKYLEFA